MYKITISIILLLLLVSCKRSVIITSNPEQYTVSVNNTVHNSPVTLKLGDGLYDLVIEADGYEKLESSIEIKGESKAFDFTLEPLYITFNLSITPENSEVTITDKTNTFNLKDGDNKVKPGRYSLKAKSPFFIDIREDIEIDIIDDYNLDLEMEPESIDYDRYLPGTEDIGVEFDAVFNGILDIPLEDFVYRLNEVKDSELDLAFNNYLAGLIEQNESEKLIRLLESGVPGRVDVNYPGRYSFYQSTFANDDVESFSKMIELNAHRTNFIYSDIIAAKAYAILEFILDITPVEDLNKKLIIKDSNYDFYGIHYIVFQCKDDKTALSLFIDKGIDKEVYEIGYPEGITEMLDVSKLVKTDNDYIIEKKRYKDPRYTDPRFEDVSNEYETFSQHDSRFIEFLRATNSED